jgi:hypothetical protein
MASYFRSSSRLRPAAIARKIRDTGSSEEFQAWPISMLVTVTAAYRAMTIVRKVLGHPT